MTRVVGLTGNVASGKSTVARMLAARGATVIDADILAREAVAPGTPGNAGIRARWPHVIREDGSLDRAALRAIVFSDAKERAALDAIVHPEVAKLAKQRISEARARGDRVVVYDVPLLFEVGRTGDVDVIVVVDAPARIRRERMVRDRGLSQAEADAIIAAQMPAERKRAAADYVIDNDGDRTVLEARVDAVWNALASPHSDG